MFRPSLPPGKIGGGGVCTQGKERWFLAPHPTLAFGGAPLFIFIFRSFSGHVVFFWWWDAEY